MKGYFFIIISGILFGTIPIFSTLLNQLSVSTMEQNFFRILFSVFIIFVFLLIKKANPLKIKKQDYKFFCMFGLVGIALFFVFYVSAVVMTSVTIAVLLLYTQPIFTLILASLFLRERISFLGIFAIALSLVGVSIILKVWSLTWSQFSMGYIFGLGAGFCYALYILFGRISVALKKYDYSTVTFWSFFFGLLWLIPLWLVFQIIFPVATVSAFSLNLQLNTWTLLLGFAIIATLFAYSLFNKGIEFVESHKAGVLVILEPISAIIMGALVLNQVIGLEDAIGGVFVLISVFIITRSATSSPL